MHFHQLLRWCHEAWEESLDRYGVAADAIFPGGRGQTQSPKIALPISHCSADYLRPIHGGDHLTVELEPIRLDPCTFEVRSLFTLESQPVARGLIRHVAIAIEDRRRCALPEAIDLWLEASGLGQLRAL